MSDISALQTPAPLGLMRLKDPNEALGLAIRLLAGEAPFRDMQLGMSTGMLVEAIDANHYIFVRRDNKAIAFAAWKYSRKEDAEAWLFDGRAPEGGATRDARVAIMLAVQGIETPVVRYLMRQLRDGELGDCDTLYYMRDYGKGRGKRSVRLVRPKVRRALRSMEQGAAGSNQ
jgi:hemolysin-activating ACP:hemolysin acyltransferase